MEPTKAAIRAGIYCDHVSVRDALGRALRSESWISVAAELDSGLGSDWVPPDSRIDVLVFVALGSCPCVNEKLNHFRRLSHSFKVLVLSLDDSQGLALRALEAGAYGVLSTKATIDELLQAIRQVHKGQRYFSAQIQKVFANRYVRQQLLESSEERPTPRETEILRLLALGKNHHEIASELFVSIKTVDTHRSNLLRKLSLRNNADIARFAIRNGLIEISEEF